MAKFIIYTDIDGCLLNDSYSYHGAENVLELLKRHSIPLILSSAKTAAEILHLQSQLNIREPFICENGSAVYIPIGYFSFEIPYHKKIDNGYYILELGKPISSIHHALKDMHQAMNIHVKSFSTMTPSEIARVTNLPPEDAARAGERKYDETLVISDNHQVISALARTAQVHNLRIVHGGRFFHLMGNTDKGEAVRIVHLLYQRQYNCPLSIAVGDSRNDISMLHQVDYPVFLGAQKMDDLSFPAKTTFYQEKGPYTWSRAIMRLLSSYLGGKENTEVEQ